MYDNGVRVGNVGKHGNKIKTTSRNQFWFPEDWTKEDVRRAGEHVLENGKTVYEDYGGVRVGVNKTDGKPGSVFPDGSKQPSASETSPIVTPNSNKDEDNKRKYN